MLGQQIFNGVVMGAVYALFGLGLTLVFGMVKILNLAHGAVFMWGAMVGLYAITQWHLGLPAAFALALLSGGVLSVLLEVVVFRQLRRRQGDELTTVVASVGANLILMTLAQQVTNAEILRFPFGTFPVQIFRGLGIRITLQDIAIIVAVVIMVSLLLVYLFRTRFGAQVRAVAVNERTSTLLGINPDNVYLQIFFTAGLLAGAAGMVLGIAFNSVSYIMGEGVLLQAFVVIVLGGLSSVMGTVLGGVLIGVIQALATGYLSSELSDTILFGILFLVLMVRPSGIFPGIHVEHRVA